ncbi:MAG: hypothetical protein WC329_02930 [Candidatus Omnitrophota bacterium]|jgi:hypothetical protein
MGLDEVGIMGAFTPAESWTKGGQDLAGANEIIASYIEHKQALGQSVEGINLLTEGANAQDRTIWSGIMGWLEANCVYFIDSANGPLNEAGTGFLYYTKATWQAAAGLNVSATSGDSFRRKVNKSDDWSYGFPASGDIRGAWCFEDIQKGFSALQYTVGGATHSIEGCLKRRAVGENHIMNCEAARTQNINNWNAASWAEQSPAAYYWVIGSCCLQTYDKYFWSTRYTEKIKIYVTDFILPFVADTYFLVRAIDGAFMDIDGIGAENGKYFKANDVSDLAFNSAGDSYTSDYLFKNEGNPIELIPINCSSPWNAAYAINLYNPVFLTKWVFTYN